MTTSTDVVNEVLQIIGAQTTITALSDGSPAGNAAGVIYTPVVNLMLRQIDPAFARRTAALSAPGGLVTPIVPWAFEYAYPADCLRVRQVRPPAGGYDADDPQPVRAAVAYDVLSGNPVKVILTDQAGALAVYTTSAAMIDAWDAVFYEAVVRRLGNPLAMALAGRPDFARELLEESERYAQLSDAMDEG